MMSTEKAMLKASSMSSSRVGSGTTIIMMMPMIAAGTPIWGMRLCFTATSRLRGGAHAVIRRGAYGLPSATPPVT